MVAARRKRRAGKYIAAAFGADGAGAGAAEGQKASTRKEKLTLFASAQRGVGATGAARSGGHDKE